MTRSDLTDKYHRVCKQCGYVVHVNIIRAPDTYECDRCGCEYFTRRKQTVGDV